ncbi:hypothetical protein F2Q69_00063952 [Brassica cretica]|uniref:Uncharacterized protein n=1 Tax=Brassica cretica TaxID=69181 RepID=A0A8S9RA47_BRACR|nr:hypothetical protein F2Q69_00063952 [Brassica cretica]
MKYIEDEMEQGLNPYPHKIDVSVSISEYIRKYGNLHDDEVVKDVDLINAYTELNNLVVKRQYFPNQLNDQQLGDDEAIIFDENYCKAL